MKEDFPLTDAVTASYPNLQIEQRVAEAKKAILRNTGVPVQLVRNNDQLVEEGFRDSDLRVGVLDLLSSGELILNQDRTLRRTRDYQLELNMNNPTISSAD